MYEKAKKYYKVSLILYALTIICFISQNTAFNLQCYKLYLIFKVAFIVIEIIAIFIGGYVILLAKNMIKDLLKKGK